MNTLIIHPKDPTTTFLKPIYAPIINKTIINGGINKTELKELIDNHDRILMFGHGSPQGLFSSNQFPIDEPYIVDDSMVESISKKTDNVFIWCHANQFVRDKGLNGFCTGMFISEIEEAWYYHFWDLDERLIHESNERFSSIVGRYIDAPIEILFDHLICGYGLLAIENPIARFNIERLYYKTAKSFVEVDDVDEIY